MMKHLLKSAVFIFPHLHFLTANPAFNPSCIERVVDSYRTKSILVPASGQQSAPPSRYIPSLSQETSLTDIPNQSRSLGEGAQRVTNSNSAGNGGASNSRKRKLEDDASPNLELSLSLNYQSSKFNANANQFQTLNPELPTSLNLLDRIGSETSSGVNEMGSSPVPSYLDAMLCTSRPSNELQPHSSSGPLQPSHKKTAVLLGSAHSPNQRPHSCTPPPQANHHSGTGSPQRIDYRLASESHASTAAHRASATRGENSHMRSITSDNNLGSSSSNIRATKGVVFLFDSNEAGLNLPKRRLASERKAMRSTRSPMVKQIKPWEFEAIHWAWITELWRCLRRAMQEREGLLGLPDSKAKLMAAYIASSNSAEAPLDTSKLPTETIQFIHLLWGINLRAYEVLVGQADPQSQTYIKHQEEFMKWFIDFMSNCKRSAGCSTPSELLIYNEIMAAFKSKETQGSHFVKHPNSLTKHEQHLAEFITVVTKKQTLINEAAVHVITAYHKTKNAVAFSPSENETLFVIRLGNFAKMWHSRYIKDEGSHPNETKKTRLSLYRRPECVVPFVETINPNDRIEAVPLQVKDQKVWAWLSTMKSEQHPEGSSTSTALLNKHIEIANRETGGKKQYSLEPLGNQLYRKLQLINGFILVGLGCGTEDTNHFKEQGLVRSCSDEVVSEVIKRSESPSQSGTTDQMIRFHQLFNDFLASQDDGLVYQIKKSDDNQTLNVSRKDLLVTEIAINILVRYYKTANYVKWRAIFGKEENFVEYLKKRFFTEFTGNNARFETIKLETIQSAKLIPWKNPSAEDILNGYLSPKLKAFYQDKARGDFLDRVQKLNNS